MLARERERVQRAMRRVALSAMLYVAAAAVAAIGIGFLIAALYLYLLHFLEAWQAGLAMGGIAMVMALLLIAMALGPRGREPRSSRQSEAPRASAQDEAAGELGKAAAEILSKTNLRTTDAAMIALVSGIALGIGTTRRRRNSSGKNKQRD